jgi:hypothetical protein
MRRQQWRDRHRLGDAMLQTIVANMAWASDVHALDNAVRNSICRHLRIAAGNGNAGVAQNACNCSARSPGDDDQGLAAPGRGPAALRGRVRQIIVRPTNGGPYDRRHGDAAEVAALCCGQIRSRHVGAKPLYAATSGSSPANTTSNHLLYSRGGTEPL